jgi:hypothetical protein
MAVVIVDVDVQHLLELSPADDQDPVEALAADGADPALGERVRLRRPETCADDLDSFASEDLVEDTPELAVSVVNQEADRCQPCRERPASWRACWAAQVPLGFAVQPARCTRRLDSSMKKST